MRNFAARGPAIEGAPANNNPFASMLAGEGELAAGAAGVIVSRFAWADPITGQVSNTRMANGRLGFVLPVWGPWTRIYCDAGLWILRSGQRITLAVKGDFWCRFMGGAAAGQKVYASTIDGSAVASDVEPATWSADSSVTADSDIYAADGAVYQLTGWRVTVQAPPGGLTVISPWSTFSPMQ